MNTTNAPRYQNEQGLVVLFFALSLIVISGFSALSIDWGVALDGGRKAQFAADAGALAGALRMSEGAPPVDDAEVKDEVRSLVTANGLEVGDITSIECGAWVTDEDSNGDGDINAADKRFDAEDTSSCGGYESGCTSCLASDSIRVRTRLDVGTTFGRVIGVNTLSPGGESVALFQGGAIGYCVKPFGVYLPTIDDIFPNGDGHFTVSSDTAGNWGKLDFGGVNMSSGNNFEEAMLDTNWCDALENVGDSVNPAVGDEVSPGTGFGGSLSSVFEELIEQGLNEDIVIAVNTQFPNGNNGTVTILEFITVDLVSQSSHGNNWSGDFVIIERGVFPPTGSTSTSGVSYLVG